MNNPVPSPDRLTLIYTACLHGRIDALPRLFSLIKRERASAWAAGAAAILIDLGESCMPGDWLCDVTSGRALLVALDALGYDTFFLDRADPLAYDRETLAKLIATVVTPVATVDRLINVRARRPDGGSLSVVLSGSYTDLAGRPASFPTVIQLSLADPLPGSTLVERVSPDRLLIQLTDRWDDLQIGRLDVSLATGTILSHTHSPLTADLPPDPTVSGVVDFVLGEARYAGRGRG